VLSLYIDCKKTLALIYSYFKSNFNLRYKNFIDDSFKTLKDYNFSQLLNNVFLHELDLLIKKIISENTLGKISKKGAEFSLIQDKIIMFRGLSEVQSSLKLKLCKIPIKNYMDPRYSRLSYVRYANEFIIGVLGSYKKSCVVLNQIKHFLIKTLELSINHKNIFIKKFTEGVNFLGTSIITKKYKENPFSLLLYNNIKSRLVKVYSRIYFYLPISKLLNRLIICGYYIWNHKKKFATPTAMLSLVNQTHSKILLLYNSIIFYILSFYNVVDNRKFICNIVHDLKGSCALTLALKYKLRTSSKTYNIFGPKLVCPNTNNKLHI
jgi:hypothetical protein